MPKLTIFGVFNKLLSTQNVNLARFARNVEWDFFCDFQTLCFCKCENYVNWIIEHWNGRSEILTIVLLLKIVFWAFRGPRGKVMAGRGGWEQLGSRGKEKSLAPPWPWLHHRLLWIVISSHAKSCGCWNSHLSTFMLGPRGA